MSEVSEVTQSGLTLCDPIGYSPPGSSVHGILQARKLEWVAISFSALALRSCIFFEQITKFYEPRVSDP